MVAVRLENMRLVPPFFSICIAQYNRTSFLLKCLESLKSQTFQDFEVCISDGGSTDGRSQEVVDFLATEKFSFTFQPHKENLPYDSNLRCSIGLARGRYCLLFGNDDMLAYPRALATIAKELEAQNFPEVVITNYRELRTGSTSRRIRRTQIIGSGPHVAAANFRNFSFVSGILLDRVLAQRHATNKWDGSEMYQMFIGSRIIAEGGRLLGIDQVLVLKDIQIPGETVDSYACRPVILDCPVQERQLPLSKYGRVVFEAIAPFLNPAEKPQVLRRIFMQILIFTYPPWLIEYRRIQSLKYALGVALGMRPSNILADLQPDFRTRLWVRGLHLLASTTGLLVPRTVYEGVKPGLYAFAKWSR